MEKVKRQSNIELLRIIALFMIIAYHLNVHGIEHVLEPGHWCSGTPVNEMFVYALYPGGKVGVALFFMITGYFLVRKEKVNFHSLKGILLQTFFWAWFGTMAFLIAVMAGGYFPDWQVKTVLKRIVENLVFPVSSSSYWFVTSYVILLLLAPQLNILYSKLNKRGMALVVFVLALLEYLSSYVLSYEYINLITAAFFYSVGAFIRLYASEITHNRTVAVRLTCILLFAEAWVLYVVVKLIKIKLIVDIGLKYFCNISSAFAIPVAAISVFVFVTTFDFYSDRVNLIAKTTFGIYLIHDSSLFRYTVWNNIFDIDTLYSLWAFIPVALVTIMAIFATCSALDYLRMRFVEPVYTRLIDDAFSALKRKFFRDKKPLDS